MLLERLGEELILEARQRPRDRYSGKSGGDHSHMDNKMFVITLGLSISFSLPLSVAGMPRRLSVNENEPKNRLGAEIRRLRLEAGLQIVDVARQLQFKGWTVDPVTISQIEAQTRTLTDVEAMMILDILGYDLGIKNRQP